jgi:type 1 glutamine amidotransferase
MTNMSYKALIVWGGWDGHEPKPVAEIIAEQLSAKGFETEVSDTLDAFKDVEKLKSLNLIVPIWTMGKISGEQLNPVVAAVKAGVGIGGCHGGMCDSFREATEWQFMTGGQWVAHPGNSGVTYTVKITDPHHFITEGASDFPVTSEQYYLHTDPANKVLATTRFPSPDADGPHVTNGDVQMPVVWTKMYGEGRVFYSSIGHNAATVREPDPLRILVRGLLWAAHAEDRA